MSTSGDHSLAQIDDALTIQFHCRRLVAVAIAPRSPTRPIAVGRFPGCSLASGVPTIEAGAPVRHAQTPTVEVDAQVSVQKHARSLPRPRRG